MVNYFSQMILGQMIFAMALTIYLSLITRRRAVKSKRPPKATHPILTFRSIQVLHVLCRTFESTFAPASRQETYHPGNFDVMKIMDKIDSVFMSLYSIILYMDRREETDLECMLYKLHTVLLNFPCLWGTQRCGPLLKVAKIFKKLGCLFEYQDILKKLSTIPSSFDHPPDGEVCQFLAASLPYTTDFANQVLADCWRKTTMEHALPPDLEVSCLHRAAQFENGGIMSAILDSQLALDPYPGAYNQQYLSVSNWLSSFGSSQCVQARIGIDSRDITRQTPLFIAAACGSEQACLALITGLADPNLRNDQGHTILEVAARGGHLNIVRQLLSIGAELNPQLHRATSSPLQAAIESDNYNVELVRHLLDEGADIDIRRDTDFKNAIDIASDKGYKDLADSMRSLLTSAQPQPPMTDQPIDQDPY